MTETFTASNGWYINEHGHLADPNGVNFVAEPSVESVRQLFLEERDAELGRWRDTECPDVVCYDAGTDAGERMVCTVDERNGESDINFEGYVSVADASFKGVAARYFDAHPVRKPLPTTKGLYVHRQKADELHYARILTLMGDYWTDSTATFDLAVDAKKLAQEWHDAGQLVRLAPVESEDE